MKALKRRLTGLYTITTGSILLCIAAAFLLFSIRKNRDIQLEHFQIVWNSLSSKFMSSNSFSYSFLAQTETDHQMIIHIRENGIPLQYPGSWQSDTDRQILIDRAEAQAEAEGIFMDHAPVSASSAVTSLMTIEGLHDDLYYAMVMVLSAKSGAKTLCAIVSVPPVWESLRQTALHLSLLTAGGIASLWFISWNFVGWSLKPVEESQKRQAGFIASASHELRSPLAVFKAAITAMETTPQEKDSLLSLLDSECSRMSRLVDDMLLLASADAKTWSIKTEKLDMDTLLINLYESFQPTCEEKGISLCLDLPQEALPAISGDGERIRQLLLILLDNARNYTPPGRSICIQALVHEKARRLVVQIIDEGCGIPPEIRPYVFDRFFRADSARTDKNHFGLGLSIAKELTQLHHGTIFLSDGPDGGSCFSVSLPYLHS